MSRRRLVWTAVVLVWVMGGAIAGTVMALPLGWPIGEAPHMRSKSWTARTPGVTLPKVISEVKPQYTPEAMQARIEGTVIMTAVVRTDGTPGDIEITESLDTEYGLDKQAVAALSQWRFEPGLKDGKPVPVRITIEMRFYAKEVAGQMVCSDVINFDQLLLTQCQNRIDSRSSRGGQICRGRDNRRHGGNHDHDRQAVCGGDSKQETADKAAQEDGTHETEGRTRKTQAQRLPQEAAHELCRARPERYADADLARALGDGICRQAIDADRRERKGQATEHGQHQHVETVG